MLPIATTGAYRMRRRGSRDPRLVVLVAIGALAWVVIAVRLFTIQIRQGEWYAGLATGQRELYRRLLPERGSIVVHDRRMPDGWYPIATNRQTFTVFAVPKDIRDPRRTARLLAPLLGLEEAALAERLQRAPSEWYLPLKRKVPRAERDAVLALALPGMEAEPTLSRYYPDGAAAAHLTGFVGEDAQGVAGRYGLESAFEALLAGTSGELDAERDPRGRWIVFGKRAVTPAVPGASLHLTVERELQLEVCAQLAAAVEAHGASGGTVVVLAPRTGAVRAMCSVPSYDPNRYQETTDLARFNPAAIVAAYEPGSVFKPVTMAAAVDAGVVEPGTTYEDTGSVVVDGRTITNTDDRVYGRQTMADVLRFSINTGAVFVARTLGIDRFRAAIERFGFGVRTGIELAGEVPGDTASLAARRDIYLATASYGQGITVTPLQLAVAYATIANGGVLMRPHLVEEVLQPDGTRQRAEPQVVRQVLSTRTATLLQGMLVSVVRDGYPTRAGVPGYLIGGKTGTAQIPLADRPGYGQETIHTFAGFGPADDPRFAMVVRLDRPKTRRFADSTAAPLFGTLARYIFQYDGIPPRAE